MKAIFKILILSLVTLNTIYAKEENMQIKMLIDNEAFIIDMADNSAARDFVNMLPLELDFDDFMNMEKKSNALPKALNTQGIKGYDPEIGDLFYFSPWGNIGIFYAKASFHSGLVLLGRLKGGVESIKNKKESFKIRFEVVE